MIRQTLVGAAAGIALSAVVAATVSWAQQPPRPNPQAPSANQPVQGVSDAAVLGQKLNETNQKVAALEKELAALKAKFEGHHHVLENYNVTSMKTSDGKATWWIVGHPAATGPMGDVAQVTNPIMANKGVPTGKPKP